MKKRQEDSEEDAAETEAFTELEVERSMETHLQQQAEGEEGPRRLRRDGRARVRRVGRQGPREGPEAEAQGPRRGGPEIGGLRFTWRRRGTHDAQRRRFIFFVLFIVLFLPPLVLGCAIGLRAAPRASASSWSSRSISGLISTTVTRAPALASMGPCRPPPAPRQRMRLSVISPPSQPSGSRISSGRSISSSMAARVKRLPSCTRASHAARL